MFWGWIYVTCFCKLWEVYLSSLVDHGVVSRPSHLQGWWTRIPERDWQFESFTAFYRHSWRLVIIIIIIIDRFYVALFSVLEQTHCTYVTCDSEWATVSFLWCIFLISNPPPKSDVLMVLFDCDMAGATWNYCRFGAHSVYTIQPCTSLHCHFIQSHICRVYLYPATRTLSRITTSKDYSALQPAAKGPQEETSDRWLATLRRRHCHWCQVQRHSVMPVMIQHMQDATYHAPYCQQC